MRRPRRIREPKSGRRCTEADSHSLRGHPPCRVAPRSSASLLGIIARPVPGRFLPSQRRGRRPCSTRRSRATRSPARRSRSAGRSSRSSATERQPIYGSSVFIRLVSVDRTSSTEVRGTESPTGSGHYVASIEVPAGGIGEVVVGLVGEACTASGLLAVRHDLPVDRRRVGHRRGAAWRPRPSAPPSAADRASSCCRWSRSASPSRSSAGWRRSSIGRRRLGRGRSPSGR